MDAPTVSPKIYVGADVALLAFTLSTVLIRYVDLGWFSMFIALLIAVAKATLIASFFMHALYEKMTIRVVTAGALLWFLILVTLTMADYITPGWLPVAGK
jgi:cytochrome c oxidase subunit IV